MHPCMVHVCTHICTYKFIFLSCLGLHCYHLVCALALVVMQIVKSLIFFSHHLNLFIYFVFIIIQYQLHSARLILTKYNILCITTYWQKKKVNGLDKVWLHLSLGIISTALWPTELISGSKQESSLKLMRLRSHDEVWELPETVL